MEEPKLFEGGVAIDDRGFLCFVNSFDFSGVRRFYEVANHSDQVIRAFHGHRNEAKYLFVAHGSVIVAVVPLDDLLDATKKRATPKRFVLSALKPSVLYIPKNYANGFRMLEPMTRVIFYSTSTLEESRGDDIRFPYNICGEDLWQVENR